MAQARDDRAPPIGEQPSDQRQTIDERLTEQVLDDLIGRMIAHQRARVLTQAQAIDPRLCADDILQPDDYPALAGDPRWNYEDGVLAGMQAIQIALRSELRRRG